jgi:tight adherence protein B
MSPLLLMLLAFLAVALAVFGAYSVLSDVFLRDRSRVSKRVDDQLRKRLRDQAKKSILFKEVGPLSAESMGDVRERLSLRQRFVALVEQSGLNLTPQRLLLIMAAAGLTLGLLAGLLLLNVLVAAGAALIGAAVPLLYVSLKRAARLGKLIAQLPDAFDLMARVIRAGQTMSQALQAVADGFDRPISAEFSYCFEQQNLGLPPEVALRDLARRTGLLEIRIFVLALLVQQQTGGNLAELLERLATVIRSRFRTRSKIRALTAEGRFQAIILLALPFVMFGILLAVAPGYVMVLFAYPWWLVGMVVFEVLGALWIRKIVNFDF